MAARSIASLTLSFGLVSIPVKLYSATESQDGIRFNFLHTCGSRVRQQYVCIKEDRPVERSELIKGYEFEKDRYVTFEPSELKALEESTRHSIDIVAFVPLEKVDPIYYDKAYYLAPDKRGAKPYGLLMDAMRESGRCALATWAWRGKQYVVQVRPGADGLVLQQLLYADEVRPMKELDIEHAEAKPAELALALQLIEQISVDDYDADAYRDDEKERIKQAIDEKIAGKDIVLAEEPEGGGRAGAEVIDIVEALKASLGSGGRAGRAAKPQPKAPAAPRAAAPADEAVPGKERKAPKRAPAKSAASKAAPAPARARAGR